MTINRRTHLSVVLVTAAACCLFAGFSDAPGPPPASIDVAIVVHPETPIAQLSMADVRKVFRGERQYWTPEIPVVLLVRAPVSREREVVLRVIYQMNEAQFKQYWIAKIFRAEAAAGPKIVYSNDVANQLAGAIPGAVAFLPAGEVKPPLKVVRVDGKLPGEAGYILR